MKATTQMESRIHQKGMPQKRVFLFSFHVFSFQRFSSMLFRLVPSLEDDIIRTRLWAVECLAKADGSVIDCGLAGVCVCVGSKVVCMSSMPGSVPATGALLWSVGGSNGIFSGPSSGYRL